MKMPEMRRGVRQNAESNQACRAMDRTLVADREGSISYVRRAICMTGW